MNTGRIDPQIFQYAILTFAAVAAVTDLIWGKIYNLWVVVIVLSGLCSAHAYGGLSLLIQGLLGLGAGLLLYGWMFAIGMMGGGDVKFLMALGVWGGPLYVTHVALLAILLGGGLALVLLTFQGRIRSWVDRVYLSVLSLVLKDVEFRAPELDKKMTFPFGIPLAIAAVWVAYDSPIKGFFL